MEVNLVLGASKLQISTNIPITLADKIMWQTLRDHVYKTLKLNDTSDYDLFLIPIKDLKTTEERLQPDQVILQLGRYFNRHGSDATNDSDILNSRVSVRVIPHNFEFYPMRIEIGNQHEDLFFTDVNGSSAAQLKKEILQKILTCLELRKEEIFSKPQVEQAISKLLRRKNTSTIMTFVFEEVFNMIVGEVKPGYKLLRLVSSSSINSTPSKPPEEVDLTIRKRERTISLSDDEEEVQLVNHKRAKRSDSEVHELMDLSKENEPLFDLTVQIMDNHLNSSSSTSPCCSSSNPASSVSKFTNCLICYDELPSEDLCQIACSKGHSYCYSCIARSIRLQIEGSEDTAVQWPSCPLSASTKTTAGCNYELKYEKVCQILNRAAYLPPTEAPFPSERLPELLEKLERLSLRKMSEQECCIRCPKCPNDLTAYCVSLSDCRAKRSRIDCPFCEISFCSKCSVSPYHYFGKCEDINSITIGWYDWKQGKEDVLLKAMESSTNPKDRELCAQYKAKREEYQQHYGEDLDESEIQAKLQEIEKNEKEMEKTCRVCPNCGAPATKISGCDHVVCGGMPYTGTNTGRKGQNANGCGRSFNWSSAVKYQSKECRIDITSFTKAEGVKHEIAEGVPMTCDLCTQPIVGPRIRCINCPSYNICFACIPKQKPLRKSRKKLPPLPPALLDPNYTGPIKVEETPLSDLVIDPPIPTTTAATTTTTPESKVINLMSDTPTRTPLPRRVKKPRSDSLGDQSTHSSPEIVQGVTRRGKTYQPETLFIDDDDDEVQVITTANHTNSNSNSNSNNPTTTSPTNAEDTTSSKKKTPRKTPAKKKKNDLGSLLFKRYEAIKEPVIAHDPSCHICEILLTAEPETVPIILYPPNDSSSSSSANAVTTTPLNQVYDLTEPQIIEEISLLD